MKKLLLFFMIFAIMSLPVAGATAGAVNKAEPVTFAERTVKISTGQKVVKLITVDPKDPSVKFEVNTPGSMLNVTEDFEKMVKGKKAYAAINANFFLSYSTIKDPIGHVMVDGKLLYGQSGITSLGITRGKDLVFGMPGIFTGLYGDGIRQNEMKRDGSGGYNYNVWPAYEVNTLTQSVDTAIMYTPARGKTVKIRKSGWAAAVRNGVLECFKKVAVNTVVNIPQDGYLTFYGEKMVEGWKGDNGLHPGRNIVCEYFLYNKDKVNPAFKLEDMQWMISGGPDLVVAGKAAPVSKHPAFSDTRFTTLSTSRTAVGVSTLGKLLLVSASSAKISEMKEIMLALDSKNAINLDGGASTAMYYNGKVIAKPERKLTTILYVYKK